MSQQLKVNGLAKAVDVDGDTPVLWVLRDVLGMTGTKFGCGLGLCGACTVHVDGVPTRSCITSVESVARKNIGTIDAAMSGNVCRCGTYVRIRQGIKAAARSLSSTSSKAA